MLDQHDVKNKILQLTTQIMLPIAVYTAAKLNIADALRDEAANLEDLSNTLGLSPKMLFRLMRFLVSHSIFKLDENGFYHLNEFSQYLSSDHPYSMKETLLIFNERALHSFTHLHSSLINSVPAYSLLYGHEYFGDLSTNQKSQACYNDAMASYSKGEGKLIIEGYDFSCFQSVVDIGGGKSDLLFHIKHDYPHIETFLFDQPQVIEHVKQNYNDNTKLVAGDFFKDINVFADCFILKRVLHDWDDASCLTILKNCRKQMTKESRLLIIDAILENPINGAEGDEDSYHHKKIDSHRMLLALDLQLLCLHGGIERTKQDFEDLLHQAGFILIKIVPIGLLSIVEVKIRA